jgi:hypothetical protein
MGVGQQKLALGLCWHRTQRASTHADLQHSVRLSCASVRAAEKCVWVCAADQEQLLN